MFFKDLVDICDSFSECENQSMIEMAERAVAVNFYHHQKQNKMFEDMCVISDKGKAIDELTLPAEIHVEKEKGQIYYKNCSPACNHCVEDIGYTARITTYCNRDCFFCFASDTPLKDANNIDISKFQKAFIEKNRITPIKSFAISGGEPLINSQETIELFKWVRDNYTADIYCRLYTNGDYITENILSQLKTVHLDEIRLSIKPGEIPLNEKIQLIKEFIPRLVIEIPVIPGDESYLYHLYDVLEETNIDGINLVELFFNGNKKHEFNSRGYKILMPNGIRKFGCAEFPYEYPVKGSYELAIDSLKYIAEKRFHYFAYICSQKTKSVQYCSSNQRQISGKLDAIYDGTVDENGNIMVIAIFGEKNEVKSIVKHSDIPYYECENNTILLPVTSDNCLTMNCDSCYLTLDKSLQPVWIKIRSLITHGKSQKMKKLKKELMEYGNVCRIL